MKLVIDSDRCKGCNLCMLVCPYRIFKEGKSPERAGDHPPRARPARAMPQLPAPAALWPDRLRPLPDDLPRPGHPLG